MIAEKACSAGILSDSMSNLRSFKLRAIHRNAQLLRAVGGQYADVCSLAQALPHGVVKNVVSLLGLVDLELIHLDRPPSPVPGQPHNGVDLIR
jgi:hypothetical protein